MLRFPGSAKLGQRRKLNPSRGIGVRTAPLEAMELGRKPILTTRFPHSLASERGRSVATGRENQDGYSGASRRSAMRIVLAFTAMLFMTSHSSALTLRLYQDNDNKGSLFVHSRLSQEMQSLIKQWQDYKRAAALLDFDDLLHTARDLLITHEEVRKALVRRRLSAHRRAGSSASMCRRVMRIMLRRRSPASHTPGLPCLSDQDLSLVCRSRIFKFGPNWGAKSTWRATAENGAPGPEAGAI